MYIDSTFEILAADAALRNPVTPAERVQELFQEWWTRRDGRAIPEEEIYILPVKVVDYVGVLGKPVTRLGALHFPKAKLTEEQIALLENGATAQESPEDIGRQADEAILWGAGRAAAIAAFLTPLADLGALMANEAYMIHRLAKIHGYTIDQSVVTMLAGLAGGTLARRIGVSLLPFLKIPIVAGTAYAIGKAAEAYFASGMTLDRTRLNDIFLRAKEMAKGIDFGRRKSGPEEASPV